MLAKAGDPKDQNNLSEIEKFHLSLCKEILRVKNNTRNPKVLGELGRLPLRITIETQLFKYLQRIPFVKEDCCLRKAFNEELANKESGWVIKVRHLLGSYGMSNSSWIYSRCWMVKYIRRNIKTTISFSKNELRTVASKPSFTLIKMKRTTFFHKQKNSLKRKDI